MKLVQAHERRETDLGKELLNVTRSALGMALRTLARAEQANQFRTVFQGCAAVSRLVELYGRLGGILDGAGNPAAPAQVQITISGEKVAAICTTYAQRHHGDSNSNSNSNSTAPTLQLPADPADPADPEAYHKTRSARTAEGRINTVCQAARQA